MRGSGSHLTLTAALSFSGNPAEVELPHPHSLVWDSPALGWLGDFSDFPRRCFALLLSVLGLGGMLFLKVIIRELLFGLVSLWLGSESQPSGFSGLSSQGHQQCLPCISLLGALSKSVSGSRGKF